MSDPDLHRARALLVDSNALLRSISCAQLRDLGIAHIAQVSRAADARLLLERERFDIVVCAREMEGSALSGQDLLDELRREQLLPHSTVFIMVAADATYQQVMEAAESALDGLLVRPYTAAAFTSRLLEARRRKHELDDVLRALDAGETEVALARAVTRFRERQPYWLYCARLAAELLLTLSRPDDAQRIFERVAQTTPGASWARLGAARALLAQGSPAAAHAQVSAVLAQDPLSADACELLGRILIEQCAFDDALVQYRQAAELTPGCLLRAQHAGALSFYQGQGDEALGLLERTLAMGVQSKLFDALTLLLIAFLRFDCADAAGVATMHQQLQRYSQRYSASRRLQRLEQAAGALSALLVGAPDAALAAAAALATQAGEPLFDLEAANVVLALWVRLPPPLREGAGYAALVERIGLRFCLSKAIAQVLVASSRGTEPAAGLIRQCQLNVAAAAEQALERSLQGDVVGATRSLLEAGERTLNAKLLELCCAVAGRNGASTPQVDALAERARAALHSNCQAINHIAGLQRSGRSPGGLLLRGRACATANAAD